jgi:UDP-N-acetylmuramoyl-tripeptide--D-alanyl-D-alanine ligase
MSASVEMLGSMEASRRTAVLGDMKELGGHSDDRHRALGECLAEAVVDAVFWLGDEAAPVREGYELAGGRSNFKACKTLDELTTEVVAYARAGDAILVKASRSVGLDGFVAVLLDRLESNTEN